MSFEGMESQRRDTVDSIFIKFGTAIEKAEQNAAAKISDPSMKKLMAARMALEFAVLATALEKNCLQKWRQLHSRRHLRRSKP